MRINVKEVGWFGLVNMVAWMVSFLIVCFWDVICGVQITHHEGYGLGQIGGMVITGILSFWSWTMEFRWFECLKKGRERRKGESNYVGK